MSRKKKDPTPQYRFPDQLLAQINEHSAGGFILFNFSPDGIPQIYCQADSNPHLYAIQHHVLTWADAIKEVNKQITVHNVLNS